MMPIAKDHIFEKAPYAIIVADLQGQLTDVNLAAVALTGYNRHEMLSRHFTQFLYDEDRGSAMQHFEYCMAGQKTYLEIPYRHKSGNKRWWSVAAEKITDDQFVAFCYDITQRKTDEQQLLISEKKLLDTNKKYLTAIKELKQVNAELNSTLEQLEKEQNEKNLILNSITDAVLYHDVSMKILWANNNTRQVMNITPQELTGHFCYDKFGSTPGKVCHDCPVATAIDKGEPAACTRTLGDGRVWRIKAFPVLDPAGNILGAVETINDITATIQKENETLELKKRYEAFLKALPDLLFIIDKDGFYRDYYAADPTELLAPPELFLNKNMAEILPAEIYQKNIIALKEAIRTGETTYFDYPVTIHGITKHFDCIMVKMDDEMVMGIVREITRQKQNEVSLQEKIQELEKFNLLMVGRENRMRELKQEVNELRSQLNLPPRYNKTS